MSHVHTHIKHSGELAFLDSTSNVEEGNLWLFLLCTHSAVGGLLLAVFLCNNESEKRSLAMDLVKECLPFNAFFGRSKEMGPEVFLTDNNNEERAAVSNA